MGFLAPWFLAGLAGLALPVYLHLLRRHKTTPLRFSSLMFLERRTQSSIKHRRLRYFLLLAARLLLLLVLALAFAGPFINRSVTATAGAPLLMIAIDNSFSMREGRRLEEAKRQALALLAGRAGGQRAQVVALGAQLHLLTQPVQDSGELRSAVASIRPGDSQATFAELVRALRSMAQSSPAPVELHLFSDFQKTALPVAFAEIEMPANVRLVSHALAPKTVPNWAVQTVDAPVVMWDPKKARVQVTVAGFGTPEARLTVSLAAGGRVLASKAVLVPPSGRAAAEFESLDVPYGLNRCEIRIDTADTLPQDDRFLFAVERSDPRRVLFLHESRDTRSPFYYGNALASAGEAAFQLEAVPADRAGNLDPSRFAFVVLADVASVPAPFAEQLGKYVRSGGSVLVSLGSYASRSQRVPVFDEPVRDSRYYSRTSSRFQIVGAADPAHPSLRRAAAWTGVKFYQAAVVEPGPARVIARLADQTPLLLEKQIGEGRALLLTSGLENLTNDFPLNPVFIPFIEQTAYYLAGLEERAGSVPVNSFLQLRSARELSVSVELIDPEGKRPLTLRESASLPAYQAAREGFFEIRRANGRHELTAVNADRRESDLEPIPEESLALWKNTGGGLEQSGSTKQETKPYSLWWYLMLAALLLAAAESLLAGRYLGVEQEA